MEGRVDKDNWLFDYLDSSITRTCDVLAETNLGRIIVYLLFYSRDAKFKLAMENLSAELSKSENEILTEIVREYTDILVDYLKEKHVVFTFFMKRLQKWLHRKKIRRSFRNGAQGLTVSPETSTFTTFSPVYKTA